MNKIFYALTLVFNLSIFSQINYEKGYVINQSNVKIECLIKNLDWKYNPEEIVYKLAENSEAIVLKSHEIKEFGIGENIKYIKTIVDIDISSEDLNNLSSERNPIFEKQGLLLEVLVEGKANLYRYYKTGLTRFFYKTDNTEITQLVFKNYENFENNSVLKNNYYKQQLLNAIHCKNCTLGDFENLEYRSESLMEIFQKYNADFAPNQSDFTKNEKKGFFVFSVKTGVSLNSLTVGNSINEDLSVDFGNELNYSFGLELEYVLPFNNNKWGVYMEPYYQNFKFDGTKNTNSFIGGKNIFSLRYQSLEIPIGLRYYFYLNNDSKLFLNAKYELNFDLDSNYKSTRADGSPIQSLELSPGNNLGIGLGYKFKNKYSIELAYHANRNLFKNRVYLDSSFDKVSLVLGYTIF